MYNEKKDKSKVAKENNENYLTNEEQHKGAVALSISAQLLFMCKKITARPRKNPAVGVKLSYATN